MHKLYSTTSPDLYQGAAKCFRVFDQTSSLVVENELLGVN